MKNLATKLEDAVFSAMGTIVRVEGSTFVVQTDDGPSTVFRAARAVSCLVEPKLHDFVLLGGRGRSIYVLAILERESPDVALASPGNVSIQAGERLRMIAGEDVEVVTPKAVNLTSSELGIHTSRAKVFAAEILAVGTEVIGELSNVKLKGTFLDKVFERVSERVQRSIRRVEEIDQLKAKQVDWTADETMSLRSDNMVATAKELVKVDGEQIHFG